MAVHDHLVRRAPARPGIDVGVTPANAINNVGIQVLIALIGAGMVLGSIWFFFWAKNGGFVWREGDWEDYKSTVLRRKGPDGKTLSNATKSTKLGGGSVVHGGSYTGESSVGYTDETTSSAGFTEMREVEAGHGGLRGGEAKKKHRRRSDKHTNDYKDPELREYRHEKPARVGGLNRQADGIYTDYSATEPSEVNSNVSKQPLIKDKGRKSELSEKEEAKAKKKRAIERMREAKRLEKAAEKMAAAEAKAAKNAEKAQAKKDKAEQKKSKKHKEMEATPSEYPATEYLVSEYPATEYPATEYPATEAPSEAPRATQTARRGPPSAAYSFTTGDDATTTYSGAYTASRKPADDATTTYSAPYTAAHTHKTTPSEANESSYYSDYRPNADPSAFPRGPRAQSGHRERERERERRSASKPRSSGQRKHRSSRHTTTNTDIFSQGDGEDLGTKAYPCHIPGLSSAGSVGVSESVSQVGGPSSGRRGRDVMDGYRRAGAVRVVGRRDSLSDSD